MFTIQWIISTCDNIKNSKQFRNFALYPFQFSTKKAERYPFLGNLSALKLFYFTHLVFSGFKLSRFSPSTFPLNLFIPYITNIFQSVIYHKIQGRFLVIILLKSAGWGEVLSYFTCVLHPFNKNISKPA